VELQLRRSSRLTVVDPRGVVAAMPSRPKPRRRRKTGVAITFIEEARLIASAVARTVSPAWRRSAISIRSASDRNRGEIAFVVKGSRGGTN
jgi:hypothetical protein